MDTIKPTVAMLQAQMDQAKEAYQQAKLKLWSVYADVPSGLPHPDGAQRVQIATREHNAALRAYVAALQRLNEYLIRGTVREDPGNSPASGENRDDKSSRQAG